MGIDQKGLPPALQPNQQQTLDFCRYPALVPYGVVCSASVPARHKVESAGNLLASPLLLISFLTDTAVKNSANFGFGGWKNMVP